MVKQGLCQSRKCREISDFVGYAGVVARQLPPPRPGAAAKFSVPPGACAGVPTGSAAALS